MAGPRARESLDGSESNFSLVDHGFTGETALSEGGYGDIEDGASAGPSRSANALRAYYPISTIMSNPRAASAAQTISTNLSNLNPLRPTTGPKTGATRGRAATPVVLSDLPKVSAKTFGTYIDSIKDEFTAWSRIQDALADAPILDELDDDDALLDEEASKRRKAIKRALETSNISFKSSKKVELPTLEIIPPIFFEENFNLANPRTFDVVTGGETAESRASDASVSVQRANTDFATDQILQEKLSHWLDVVELHLNVEISLRSASFFSALSNLKELDSQSAEAVKQISEIKGILNAVDAGIARKGLFAVRQGMRRRRLNDLDVALDRVKEILRAVEQAEDLGEAGETEGALDLADEIEKEWEMSLSGTAVQIAVTPAVEQREEPIMSIISEENEDDTETDDKSHRVPATPMTALRPRGDHHAPVRIANIKCLADIPMRLGALRSAIAQTLEHELVAVLVHAIREGGEALSSCTEQWRTSPGARAPIYDELRDSYASRARSCLHGLVRCGKPALDDAIIAWKAALLKEVRKTVRDLVPSSGQHDDDDTPADNTPSSRSSAEGKRPSLDGIPQSNTLQQLDQAGYLDVIRRTHTSLLSLLILADIQSRAISSTVEQILERKTGHNSEPVTSTGASSGKALNDAWITALQADLTDVVQVVAELMNVRLARLVASRGDVHSRLSPLEFYTVFTESWQFVLDCEVVCRKMIVGLRGVIVSQAKAFLQHFHQQTFLAVAEAVEHEQWSPVDVPSSTQKVVDDILQSAVDTPRSWEFKRDQGEGHATADSVTKQLAIEDRSFFAVGATLRCLEALEAYLKVVINLPLLTTDVMSRIVEFLKMVLGAGAMRSAGLKNITAKHLAMASQSISILISIIPYARECLRRHLRAKQAIILVDFDKLKRDCQEHQNEIHAKLVAIMGDRLAVHCKTLQEIDWDQSAPATGRPNAYMETLVKETGTLHKVLLKYLAGNALEIVMMQVLSAINSRLAEEFSRVPLKSEGAKERMLTDARFLKEKFADLKGLERAPPGAELVHLVQDRIIERPPAPAQPKGKPFNTPSMTQTRKPISLHSRSASSTSVAQVNDKTDDAINSTSAAAPRKVIEETSVPLISTSEASVADAATSSTNEETQEVVAVTQTQAERIPLPMSPKREVPKSVLENLSDTKTSVVDDSAPSTPSKDERPFSPPVPEKMQEPPPGLPTVNVKNRLAGLFAKRPSLPHIDVPALRTIVPKPPKFAPLQKDAGSVSATTTVVVSPAKTQNIVPTTGTEDTPKVEEPRMAPSPIPVQPQSPTENATSSSRDAIIKTSQSSTDDLAVHTTLDSPETVEAEVPKDEDHVHEAPVSTNTTHQAASDPSDGIHSTVIPLEPGDKKNDSSADSHSGKDEAAAEVETLPSPVSTPPSLDGEEDVVEETGVEVEKSASKGKDIKIPDLHTMEEHEVERSGIAGVEREEGPSDLDEKKDVSIDVERQEELKEEDNANTSNSTESTLDDSTGSTATTERSRSHDDLDEID